MRTIFLAWEMAALAGAVRRLMNLVRQEVGVDDSAYSMSSPLDRFDLAPGKTSLRRMTIWAIL